MSNCENILNSMSTMNHQQMYNWLVNKRHFAERQEFTSYRTLAPFKKYSWGWLNKVLRCTKNREININYLFQYVTVVVYRFG